jgi:formamidopyrimidine-DNA glycosylase
MPELPEVEVTRQRLAPSFVGRRIAAVRTTVASYFFLTPPAVLKQRLLQRTVVSLSRQGKYLLAELDDASRLLLHLGMTGQLFTKDVHSPRLLRATGKGALTPELQGGFRPDQHTHLSLQFDDAGPEVLFRDVRKFGKVRWLRPGQSDPRLDKLGPDALTAQAADLSGKASKRSSAVKLLLLDQSVLAGVGNIYADEALFLAGVRPTRPAHKVSAVGYERVASEVRRVLERSIASGGSSISDYILPDGSDGGFQHEHHVYGREGAPCTVCGTVIRRVVLGGRSSHFCPRCQK